MFSKKIFIQKSKKKGVKTLEKFVLFPEIVAEMERRGETRKDLARLLELDVSQITRKLNGDIQWTIGDIEVMTLHYNKDFWELFRKNKKEEEK